MARRAHAGGRSRWSASTGERTSTATTRPPTAPPAARRLPTLVGWSLQDDLEELHGDPIWRSGPDGVTIDSGHHMAEEAPEEVAAALAAFLR